MVKGKERSPLLEYDNTVLKSRRLMQISGITLVGLLLIILVADDRIRPFLMLGGLTLIAVLWLAAQRNPEKAASVFLWCLTMMLSSIAWVSEGVRDMSLLAYPSVLIFAAILGSKALFFSLLTLMVGFATIVGLLSLSGWHEPYYYELAPRHIVFTDVILILTGFSAYMLLRDQRKLLVNLKEENFRVRERELLIGDLANQDQLTGLYNRRFAETEFSELSDQCQCGDGRLALLFFDLDNFKPVNDSLGHAAGDLLLRELADRLKTVVAKDDILCRFGGDEFLVLTCFSSNDQGYVTNLADQLIAAASIPFYIQNTRIEVSGSIGIAIAPEHGDVFSELCRHADAAMYQAKEDGRHIYRIYDDSMSKASAAKLSMMADLREALVNKEFQVYYQPQIDLASRQVCGAEALIRWQRRDGSFVPPDEFIPLAESSGIIADIGCWVLREACRDCAGWRQAGFTHMSVSVNLSYVQFRDGELECRVRKALDRVGLPAQALELELTESMLIGESPHIQKQIAAIRAMGVNFAIDDFGTGYSNLGYLRRFSATRLKIDKSFVMDMGGAAKDKPLVRAIIQMCDSLGLEAVAEGVEDNETVRELLALGCHQGQGYLWSKAITNDAFLCWLSEYGKQDLSDPFDYAQL